MTPAEQTLDMIEAELRLSGVPEEEVGDYYGGGEDALAWHLGVIRSVGRAAADLILFAHALFVAFVVLVCC